MKLVVGLGNPGAKYAQNRHNVGFMVADELARRMGASFGTKKFGAEIAEGAMGGEKVWVVKPQTFMNASGETVGPAMRFWKLGLGEVVVVHDDLELTPFRVQLKVGGGHGGHNGLKSLQTHLGGADFVRVRVGIGRPPPVMDPADYVLGSFGKGEAAALAECVNRAADAAEAAVKDGPMKAMNVVNRRG